eukprot:2638657-Pleurochrysis_carterae.AAC.1
MLDPLLVCRDMLNLGCRNVVLDARNVRELVGVFAEECMCGCGGAGTGVMHACWRACGRVVRACGRP